MLPVYHICMLSTFNNCNGDVVKHIVLGKCPIDVAMGEKIRR